MKERLVSFILESLQNSSTSADARPKIPYVFRTPSGQVIDLRLHNRDLMSRVKPHLRRILNSALAGWFVERKHTIFGELEKEGIIAAKDVEKIASERISAEYLERVADAILKDKSVQELGSGVAELLVEQVRTSAIVAKVQADFSMEHENHRANMDRELQTSHPILYKVEGWLLQTSVSIALNHIRI